MQIGVSDGTQNSYDRLASHTTHDDWPAEPLQLCLPANFAGVCRGL